MLFSTIEKLTNPSPHLAPDLLSIEKCNEFATFFINKVENIRQQISSTLHSITHLETPTTQSSELSTMSNFSPIDADTLEKPKFFYV